MMRTTLVGFTLLLLSSFPALLSARPYSSAAVTTVTYRYDRDCDRGYYRRHRDCDNRRWRRDRRHDRDYRYGAQGGYWR
jgi:hypothetical protein